MNWALAGLMLASGSISFAADQQAPSDLDLWAGLSHSLFYADYQFQCHGYARATAKAKVREALGKNFDARIRRTEEGLVERYGRESVTEASTVLPIGHKLTASNCRKFKGITSHAKATLAQLETRLGE